jgi:hypothetical protein
MDPEWWAIEFPDPPGVSICFAETCGEVRWLIARLGDDPPKPI